MVKREMGRGWGVYAGKEREEKEMIRTRDPENVSAYPGRIENIIRFRIIISRIQFHSVFIFRT